MTDNGEVHARHMLYGIYSVGCPDCEIEFEAEQRLDEMKKEEDADKTAMKLHQTIDAEKWALEFIKIFDPTIDIDTIRGWFANAIVAGYDKGYESGLKFGQDNSIDIDRLGRAVHNLRWCKNSDTFHDLAHGATEDSAYNYETRERLKEAYEKADEEEKILYGGNA